MLWSDSFFGTSSTIERRCLDTSTDFADAVFGFARRADVAAKFWREVFRPRPSMAAAEPAWYYIDAKQNYVGPVDTAALLTFCHHEYINATTYVWAQHLDGWERISALEELRGAWRGAASPAEVSAAEAAATRRAATASPVSPAPASARLPEHGAPAPVNGLLRSLEATTAAATPLRPSPAAAGTPAKLASRAAARTPTCAGGEPTVGAARPRTDGAPEADDPWDDSAGLRILDANRRVRSIIGSDGEVKDCEGAATANTRLARVSSQPAAQPASLHPTAGSTMAFIEASGEVGSHQMEFLGTIHRASGQVVDRLEEVVGEVDQGRGYVRDAQGGVIAEVRPPDRCISMYV